MLALLAYNLGEIKPTDSLRALVLAIVLAGALLLLLRLILRDWDKAAAVTTLTLLLLFSYGHLYASLKSISPQVAVLVRHRSLAPTLLLLYGLVVWLLARRKIDLNVLTQMLNLVGLILLVFPAFQMGLAFARQASAAGQSATDKAQFVSANPSNDSLPDIYYIVLDAYSRDDVLENHFKYDNSAFLQELERLGFYVARCSQSNYAETRLSVTSTLNMDYHTALSKERGQDPMNKTRTSFLLKQSQVRRMLGAMGYKTVAFETGYTWSQLEDAEVYLSPVSRQRRELLVTGGKNGFETLLLKTTAGLLLVDGALLSPAFIEPVLEYPNELRRQQILFILDYLPEVAQIPGPKFVFVHIGSPHFPYIFDANGERVPPEIQNSRSIGGYRDQVIYLNSRMIPILEEIIARSPTPPIILVQGDHGGDEVSPEDRMRNLSAYYLPGEASSRLYEGITPVNSFRLIFDEYFSGDYPLLEDIAYFSKYAYPYDVREVPDTRPGCPP